jgi:hypothetical protein
MENSGISPLAELHFYRYSAIVILKIKELIEGFGSV